MSRGEPSNRRVYISGATWYLGRHVCVEFIKRGYAIATSARSQSRFEGLQTFVRPGGVEDLGRQVTVARLVDQLIDWRPTVIIHLAAKGRASHKTEDIQQILETNVVLGTALLESARGLNASGGCAFVGAGSFWQNSGPVDGYHPNSLYAASKQALEDIGRFYWEVEGVPCVFLRPTDVYGPDDERSRFLTLVAAASRTGTPLAASSGSQLVSFVHVRDVASAVLHASEQLLVGSRFRDLAYSIAGPTFTPLRETVEGLAMDLGIDLPVSWGARTDGDGKAVVNPDLGRTLPGWHPIISLTSGFGEMMGLGDG